MDTSSQERASFQSGLSLLSLPVLDGAGMNFSTPPFPLFCMWLTVAASCPQMLLAAADGTQYMWFKGSAALDLYLGILCARAPSAQEAISSLEWY
jgi:hypothetical protein